MKSALLACLLMGAAFAHAQNAAEPAAESKTSPEAEKASPFVFEKANLLSRCEQPAFAGCLEMDEASCKTAMSEATDEANAAMAAEVAKAKPTTEAMTGYVRGVGMGRLIGGMTKRTKGKFYSCMSR